MKLKVFLFLALFFSSFVVFADGYGLQLCTSDITTGGCVIPSNCTSAGLIVVKTGQESFGGLYTCMASDPCPAGKHTDTNQSSSTYGQCIDDLKACADGVTYVTNLANCPPAECNASLGEVNDPLDPSHCITQCITYTLPGGLTYLECPSNPPECKYKFNIAGVDMCFGDPPPNCTSPQVNNPSNPYDCITPASNELTCPDGVTKVTDLSQCPAYDDASCAAKYGPGWVWNVQHQACVSTNTCPDGSPIPALPLTCETQNNPPQTCPDGSPIPALPLTCETQNNPPQTCPDGSPIPALPLTCETQNNPPQTGSCDLNTHHIDEYGNCVSNSTTCPDGSIVYPPDVCPSSGDNSGGTTGGTTGGSTGGTTGGSTTCTAGDACNQTKIKKNTKDAADYLKIISDFFKTTPDGKVNTLPEYLDAILKKITDFQICPTGSTAIYCTVFGTSEPVPIQEKQMPVDFEKKMTFQGQCPQPIQIDGGFWVGHQSLSLQPMCDFATRIKPLILAAFSLMALFVITPSFRQL